MHSECIRACCVSVHAFADYRRPGGTITFQFRDKDQSKSYGEIVAIEPPDRFVWTWEGELAVWELTALDEHTTRLIFAYSKLSVDYAVKAPAGFHDLLDLLEDRLDGSEKISPFGARCSPCSQAG